MGKEEMTVGKETYVNVKNYYTQMEAARKGIVTPEMEIVAKKEGREVSYIQKMVAEGKVVIPANPNHKGLDPNGIGSMLKTKINVNLGVSRLCVMELHSMSLDHWSQI